MIVVRKGRSRFGNADEVVELDDVNVRRESADGKAARDGTVAVLGDADGAAERAYYGAVGIDLARPKALIPRARHGGRRRTR